MRKIYVGLLVLILLSLVFFTVYGEQLYDIGKPVVTIGRASTFIEQVGIDIPLEALRTNGNQDYVYVLNMEHGYSRIIYTVSRVDVEVLETGWGTVTIAASAKIMVGDRLVISETGEIDDNKRVILP